jgi:hypothetical protein
MRILLDECVPAILLKSPVLAGHDVLVAAKAGFAGLQNGALHRAAQGKFDLLVSGDTHFKKKPSLAPTPDMGVIVIRVTPNTFEAIVSAFEAFAAAVDLKEVVGKLVIVWRDHWEIR